MRRDVVLSTLGKISRIAGETLALRDVLIRVAREAEALLPLDGMFVARLSADGSLTLYSNTEEVPEHIGPVTLNDFSPPLRPLLNEVRRVDDAKRLVDASFFVDREMKEKSARSLLSAPLKRGELTVGFVTVHSRRPHAFSEDHEVMLLSIADILGLALEHERLWNLDLARRTRLEHVDALMPIIANALNVGEIFEQVSAVVKGVLQHDYLLLMSMSADGKLLLMDAYSGDSLGDVPRCAPNRDSKRFPEGEEYEIVSDVQQERTLKAKERALIKKLGIQSALRVPVYLEGGPKSTLNFFSKVPRRYSEEDVPIARRVADLVSLALSHKRLADEERRAAVLEQRVDSLTQELETTRGMGRVVGRSKKWKTALAQVAKVAPTETTVLLTGESGTGKEVLARMIHRASPKAGGPYVAINCAALPETLLESELFGHEKGAFTGATNAHMGRIEQAAGGILFLDEVGEMSLSAQAKLLRVLEQREFSRVGGSRTLRAQVRVLAATNRDLSIQVRQGHFRQDLYYRLRVFEIAVPPLRERTEDILPLAEHFLEKIGRAVGRPAGGLSGEVNQALKAYFWPGNVRELRNVLERATILCEGGLITLEHLPSEVRMTDLASAGVASEQGLGTLELEGTEKILIRKALDQAAGNRTRAARLLGISRPNLYYKMQKYHLGGVGTF